MVVRATNSQDAGRVSVALEDQLRKENPPQSPPASYSYHLILVL